MVLLPIRKPKDWYTTNIQGDWSTHKYIDSQPIKGYSVTLDSKGIIRLIAYTTTRQLVYYEFLEGKWTASSRSDIFQIPGYPLLFYSFLGLGSSYSLLHKSFPQ